MLRSKKCRKVCCLPERSRFGPLDGFVDAGQTINMTVDEYESIRLIDLEGLTQEECSTRMDVARTTVQQIYNEARIKLARSLVNGDMLKIEGGEYQLCSNLIQPCTRENCRKHAPADGTYRNCL